MRSPARRRLLAAAVSFAGVAVVAAAAAAAALARCRPLGARLGDAAHHLRTSSSPSVSLYERIFGLLLGGLYRVVATEVSAILPATARSEVLEIGPGPGHLALELARRVPGVDLTGVDIDPAMAERATARARAGALGDRVRFVVGDVAALPFEDASFDLVVSTFSAHHWEEPVAGLREIRRVLRPGGRAMVYDLPDAWGRLEMAAPPLLEAARAAGWAAPREEAVRWPGRHLRLVRLVVLPRPGGS